MASMMPFPFRLGLQLRRAMGMDPELLGGAGATIGPATPTLPDDDERIYAPEPVPEPEPQPEAPPRLRAGDDPVEPTRHFYEPGSPIDRVVGLGKRLAGGIGYAMSPRAGMDVMRSLAKAPTPTPDRKLPVMTPKTAGLELDPPSVPAGAGPAAPSTSPAGYTPPAMRAIRMPNGRLVFTNSTSPAGVLDEEVPLDRATSDIRRSGGPVADTMRSLIRRQVAGPIRYAEDMPKVQSFGLRTQPNLGAAAAALPSDREGGGVSTMTGTPEQQMERNLNDAFAAAALAGARHDEALNKMDPVDRSMLGNRDVQTIAYLLSKFQPQIEAETERAMKRVALIRRTVTDPKQQAADIAAAEEDMKRAIEPMQNIISVLRGVRPLQ